MFREQTQIVGLGDKAHTHTSYDERKVTPADPERNIVTITSIEHSHFCITSHQANESIRY